MIDEDRSGNLMADTLLALSRKIVSMEEDVETKKYYSDRCDELQEQITKLKSELHQAHNNNITLTSRRIKADDELNDAEELLKIFLEE